MPPPNATLEQRRDAFGSIVQWVQQNAEMLFPDNATSWCYAHGQECPAHPLCRPRQTPFYQRPLMICCAGVSCLPWTSEGSQDADASECEVPHGIWMAERKLTGSKLQEDIAFVECTPRYPIEKVFQQSLEDTHFCVWVRVGPELMGWPHKRTEEYCMLARKQKNHLKPLDVYTTPKSDLLRLILPPGGVQRFTEWMEEASLASSLGGDFLFDIDHHPNTKGNSGGSDWPVNLRHGTVVAVNTQRPDSWEIMTALEHFAAMGFLLFPEMQEDFGKSPMSEALEGLSSFQLKKFVGNGMHLVTQCAWMMYVLGNTSRVDPRQSQSESPAQFEGH
ncbi:Uncharacterized protein (Fragment) [Durusdinium trenchii]|uniref:Uncharacterized protein n=1 Tax=Durusdinium trenchii TaxID=1381693 RepID=A0ABP0KQW7_9DINO